jgi:hypothetical protein
MEMNFIIGRVTTIVLGEFLDDGKTPNPDYSDPSDIGKVNFEILYSGLNIPKANSLSKPAYPIFSFIKQYPLIGEIVYIVTGPSDKLNDGYNNQKFFYYPPYSLWNATNHNAFPNMEQYSAFVKESSQKSGPYQGSTEAATINLPLGSYFQENKKVKSLRPFEGDSLIEGRFGQSIRFGSSNYLRRDNDTWSAGTKDPDSIDYEAKPITLIINGQGKPSVKNADLFSSTVEDISRDDSSIYLTSGQVIRTLAISDIIGSKKYEFPYKGNQVLVSSDRVMLYSKKENILLFSRQDVGLSANNNIILNSSKIVSVESPRIELGGESAKEQAILGNAFTTEFIRLLKTFVDAAALLKDSGDGRKAVRAQKTRVASTKMQDASQAMLNFLNTDNHLSKITYLK